MKKSGYLHLRLDPDLAVKIKAASRASVPSATANAIANSIIRAAFEPTTKAMEVLRAQFVTQP